MTEIRSVPGQERWTRLLETWSSLICCEVKPARPIQRYGIECDLGWFALVERFLHRLDALARALQTSAPEVSQIKEKFGELRIHYRRQTRGTIRPEFLALADEFALESRQTCEVCGSPGQRFGSPSWITRCPDHLAAMAVSPGSQALDR
jgi:hypothetical protein